jgi:polysaccharide pyruvyl transferase WcaK-like protein
MHRKHLLIAYSWSTNNIGDIGITPGLLTLIKKADPEMKAVVITSQPAGTPAYSYMKEYLPKYLDNCKVIANPFAGLMKSHEEAGEPGSAWNAFYKRWGSAKLEAYQKGCVTSYDATAISDDILELFSGDIFNELNNEAIDAFKNAGFLLYNSGTTLNFGRLSIKNLWAYTLLWAMPLIIARKIELPYGINSQSVDAVEWPVELIYGKLIGNAKFFYCRDSDSLNYLKQKCLLNANSGFRPDSTFFFKGFNEEWAENFMKENSLREKNFLSIIIRYSADKNVYHDPTGGTVSESRRSEQMRKLRDFITKWTKETGQKILICPETRDAIEPAFKHLYSPLSDETKKSSVCMKEFWTSEQAYSIYKRSRIVISMEMHSIIMALNVGTPVIHNPFAEAGRKKWMMKDICLKDWLLDIDEMKENDLFNVAIAIHKNYDESEKRIKDMLILLETKALSTIAEIKLTGKL